MSHSVAAAVQDTARSLATIFHEFHLRHPSRLLLGLVKVPGLGGLLDMGDGTAEALVSVAG